MRGIPVELPACGVFIGNGVYATAAGYYVSALLAHRSWIGVTNSPQEMIDRIIDENQGNLAQVWGHARGYAPATLDKWFYALDEIGVKVPEPDWENGKYLTPESSPELKEHADRNGAGLVRFLKLASEKKLYTTFIYTTAQPQWSQQLLSFGKYYQGYDFGERFTFRFDQNLANKVKLQDMTLDMIVDDLMNRVKAHTDEYHANGWGNVSATSGNFYLDMEVAAGADIPMAEDIGYRHMNMASALSRGLYRQFELPLWGTHIAHEHYSWIPWKSRYKFPLLKATLYHKYMAGAKMIVNESGNWFIEASLCEDSPKHELPANPLQVKDVRFLGSVNGDGKLAFLPYVEEARKHFDKIGPDSEYCKSYRRVISEFYDYVKEHGTPEGQPEVTVAFAKGNNDVASSGFSPTSPVGGMFDLADINPQWLDGPPEMGWNVVKETYYPLLPVMGEYPNHFMTGTPWGMADVVTFVRDMITPEFLSANYKAILFSGWNTATSKQYEILKQYVRDGGILFISIPHFSTNITRNYSSYKVDELINQGDLSELCGVKVKGPGRRFYWAVPAEGNTELGSVFPRRFGVMETRLGDIEITDREARTLIVDDEQGQPLLIKRRYGKGEVYFLNSWAYPGALNTDHGPGARVPAQGLITTIYQHIAAQCRGSVWITDDGQHTGMKSKYICYTYFPEAKKICLQNVDFDQPRSFHLHQRGHSSQAITLGPAEFRQMDASPVT